MLSAKLEWTKIENILKYGLDTNYRSIIMFVTPC